MINFYFKYFKHLLKNTWHYFVFFFTFGFEKKKLFVIGYMICLATRQFPNPVCPKCPAEESLTKAPDIIQFERPLKYINDNVVVVSASPHTTKLNIYDSNGDPYLIDFFF